MKRARVAYAGDSALVNRLTLLVSDAHSVLYGQRDLFTIQAMAPDGTAKHSIGKVPDAAGTDGEGGVLGLAISASLNAPIPETRFGVFRM